MTSAKRAPEGAPEVSYVVADTAKTIFETLPQIQADPFAEREFARQLAAVVFGNAVRPVVERKRRRIVWRPAR